MPTSNLMELEQQMTHDAARRLDNKRLLLDLEYRTGLDRLAEQLVRGNEEGNKMAKNYNGQMHYYIKELASLVKAKREIEEKIVKGTEELMDAMAGFEKELGIVLAGREEDVDKALKAISEDGVMGHKEGGHDTK